MRFHSANYNPRAISADALLGLEQSLRVFGDISGLVLNQQTGNVICGHQRLGASDLTATLQIITEGFERGRFTHTSQQLGMAGRQFLSRELVGEIVSPLGVSMTIRIVDWPEEFEKAANVAANSPAIAGDWAGDLGGLLEELRGCDQELFDALRPAYCDVIRKRWGDWARAAKVEPGSGAL